MTAAPLSKTAAGARVVVGDTTDMAVREARAAEDPLVASFLDAVSTLMGEARSRDNLGGNFYGTTALVSAGRVQARVVVTGPAAVPKEFGARPHRIAPKPGKRLVVAGRPIGVDAAVNHPGMGGSHALTSATANADRVVADAIAAGLPASLRKRFSERFR